MNDQPKISEDGKFYWDGQRWVPMGQPVKKRGGSGRGFAIGCLLICVLIAGGVLTVGLLKGQLHTVQGTMSVHEATDAASTSCTGTGGYVDIHAGTSVVISDENGKVLATGYLGDGKAEPGICVFDFTVSDVPSADFYRIEVSHRGQVTYKKSDMEANGWRVAVELGG